jgi:hypothetical protein
MVRAWQRTGDEPHYLLAAHSLVYDGDFHLGNNYIERDYLAFYSEYYLEPHIVTGPRGVQALTHNLGLSLLIAPAYRLGGLAGVEYFLAFLGALLAAQIFAFGYDLTGNWRAAAFGWMALSFTPPLIWYVFLIYPEMAAGLCTIVVLRKLLQAFHFQLPARRASNFPLEERPTSNFQSPISHLPPLNFGFGFWVLGFSLACLPWLSSRYLPIYGLLLLGAVWRAGKERSRPWLFVALLGLAGLISYSLFSLWLYGNASPAASYTGATPLALNTDVAGLSFGRGVFGWLLDNQRGLLIASPIYVVALWGGALLFKRQPIAGLAVTLPFLVMLIIVALWGGFWTGWEYSARFLVVALPPLGAGIAYWSGSARRAVALPIGGLLLGLSLMVGGAIIAQPLRGIISSPIELLKPALDLENLIPALGAYKYVSAGREAIIGEAGGLGWQSRAGPSGLVLRQVDIPEFPFGWYTARLPFTTTAAPDTPVATIKIFSPRGGNYFSKTVYGRDVTGGEIVFNFKSPLYNGWAFTPTALVSATGQAALSLGTLTIEPEIFHSLGLALMWLVALTLAGIAATTRSGEPRAIPFPRELVLPVSALLVVTVGLSVGWSLQPHARTYATIDLNRTVGVSVNDPAAFGGQAMRADPEAGQEAGMLAATQPEIYALGRYRLTVSARADSAPDPTLTLGDVRVYASDPQVLSQQWALPASALPPDGQYHRLVFEFDNPRQQALTFILDYSAAAALQADTLRVDPLR